MYNENKRLYLLQGIIKGKNNKGDEVKGDNGIILREECVVIIC